MQRRHATTLHIISKFSFPLATAIIKCCDKTRSPSLSIINNLQQLHLDDNSLVQNRQSIVWGMVMKRLGSTQVIFRKRINEMTTENGVVQ